MILWRERVAHKPRDVDGESRSLGREKIYNPKPGWESSNHVHPSSRASQFHGDDNVPGGE